MTERLYLRLEGDPPHAPESSAPTGAFAMWKVTAPLRSHVAQLMVYREQLAPGDEILERVLPDGAVRLVFNLGDAPGTGPGTGHQVEALGASSAPALVRLHGRMHGITVTLHAGGAAALLGLPAGELKGSAVHLDQLWRGEGSRLLACMADAKSDAARVALLERALSERLRQAQSEGQQCAMRAAKLINDAAGRLSLRELAAAVGLGERRLQQLFHEHVGLSPRAFGRVARLHALLRLLREQRPPRWAQLARDAGYYDQAHLANEFRALCGLTPSLFLEQAVSQSSKTRD